MCTYDCNVENQTFAPEDSEATTGKAIDVPPLEAFPTTLYSPSGCLELIGVAHANIWTYHGSVFWLHKTL